MTACCKCATPLGDEAIYLKNGTHVCPLCYSLLDPNFRSAPKPSRIYLSAEKIIAAILLAGAGLGLYAYSSSRAAERAELRRRELDEEREKARVAHEAQVKEERISEARREDEARKTAARAAALRNTAVNSVPIAGLQKIELEKQRQEAAMREVQDARQAAEADLLRANQERERTQRELFQAQAGRDLDKQWKDQLRKDGKLDAASMRSHIGEITFLLIAISDNTVLRLLAEGAMLDSNSRAAWAAGLNDALKGKDILKQRYRFESNSRVRVGACRIDHLELTQLYESKASEIEAAAGRSNKIARLAEIANDCSFKIAAAEQRLKELGPSLVDRADAMGLIIPPPALDPQWLRKISLKNNSILWVKSYIIAGDMVSYKDERGVAKSIKKDDIEKFP